MILETNFASIVAGRIYGTNTRKIYEKFCETLGWDISKANQFGWQTPLYAVNADATRTSDVWFIAYPNYDIGEINNVEPNAHAVNFIHNNGDMIIEVVNETTGASHNANRITFVKTANKYYQFLGVYKLVENGTTRVYKRISKTYPIY